MSSWNVALTREQGQVFAIVLVTESAMADIHNRDRVIMAWQDELGCRVALLSERRFQSYGPSDIVRWLRNIHPSQLPWRKMTLAA